MPSEDRAISDFPIALQLLNTALVLASNPDGLGGYDSVHATLTEIGRVILETQYTQDLGNVDVFNAIKNCRVLSGTSNPSSSQGVDGQIYVKYQTVSNVDTVTGLYVKLNGAWVEIATGGGGGGAPVLYGTTDPTSAQGSDGQLYMKYAYVSGCEVEVNIYKATDGRTVSITITENGSTVYSATPSCNIMGAYAEVSTTITLSTGTYSLRHWGEQKDEANVESQFVEIDGHQIGFIADGANSSYAVDDTETVEIEYGGDMVIATWLKISTDWVPVDDSGAVIDDTSASVKKVYSSAKVQGVFDSHDGDFADAYDATTAYAKGDLCIYNNVLYKALQATTGNLPTNTTYWEETSIADEINGKQDTTDNSLATTDKTIVGAINELNTDKADKSCVNYSVNLGQGTYNGIYWIIREFYSFYLVEVGGTATTTFNWHTLVSVNKAYAPNMQRKVPITSYDHNYFRGSIGFNNGNIELKVDEAAYVCGQFILPKDLTS